MQRYLLLSLFLTLITAQPTSTDFEIPARVRTTVYYADLTADEAPIQTQLQSKQKSIALAWDLDQNSYSELWRPSQTSIATFLTHKSQILIEYSGSRCSKATDKKTIWSKVLETRYRTRFTIQEEGTFSDPYQPDIYPTETYSVWRSADRKLWVWVRQANKQIAYMQEYREDTKHVVVVWFPTGLTSESSNLVYEFYNFKCPTKY